MSLNKVYFYVNIFFADGAGVRILEQNFWADSLARQKRSWVVIPIGRTSWVTIMLLVSRI